MINISNKNTIIILASLAMIISVVLISLQLNLNKPGDYDTEIRKIQTQSSSDDVNAIEKDLLDTEFDSLDAEIEEIEKELDYQQ
jgi:hypothetical protein